MTHGLRASLRYQESRQGARKNVPRQSLRALVQLHVVQQYVEGVTVRVRSEGHTAFRSYRFRQKEQVDDDEHTHERGRMQDPSLQE